MKANSNSKATEQCVDSEVMYPLQWVIDTLMDWETDSLDVYILHQDWGSWTARTIITIYMPYYIIFQHFQNGSHMKIPEYIKSQEMYMQLVVCVQQLWKGQIKVEMSEPRRRDQWMSAANQDTVNNEWTSLSNCLRAHKAVILEFIVQVSWSWPNNLMSTS